MIQQINQVLQALEIKGSCVSFQEQHNYLYFDVQLSPLGRVKDLQNRSDELSLCLKLGSKPRFNILHQEGVIRVEFKKPHQETLLLADLFTNKSIPVQMKLPCVLGQTMEGKRMWMDLADNPHLLIAGSTGSGKSTLMHNLIANLLNYSNSQIFLIDPKHIEFYPYSNQFKNIQIFHSYQETVQLLNDLTMAMEHRYQLLRDGKSSQELPYIIVMIDEFADLIFQDDNGTLYKSLCQLAQKCRAAKMHLILGTQRPSVNILKGSIKANFPARIACRVASQVDSRVILDANGAETLMGKGDALVKDNNRHLERLQIAYISPQDIINYYAGAN